ncbi:putative transglutaminase-like cysteine proteinase [Caulobacter segnis]|nr:transglutaminase-like cysteine peptidase [Caulobacter segnis]MDR6624788.1 putative transglutaminase-like cysteine proteinase [Caulobacter segnis]
MPFMPRGEGVGAPVGFADLCRRDLATCGLPSSQLALMGLNAPSNPALTSSVGAAAPHPFDVAPASSNDEPLEAVTPTGLTEPAASRPNAETAAVSATLAWMGQGEREQLKLLNRVNQAVNREVKKANDLDLYGQPEYWSLPRLVDGKLYGDCEDYALEKRRQLVAAGVPESALSLAVAITARGESHAVLMISLKSGDWVLDNLTPWATPWEDLNYRWVERQVPGTALWTSAA